MDKHFSFENIIIIPSAKRQVLNFINFIRLSSIESSVNRFTGHYCLSVISFSILLVSRLRSVYWKTTDISFRNYKSHLLPYYLSEFHEYFPRLMSFSPGVCLIKFRKYSPKAIFNYLPESQFIFMSLQFM